MLTTPKPTRRIVVPRKDAVVQAFVAGKPVADIAVDTCIHRLRVEQVLREALVGLAELNQSLAAAQGQAKDAPIGVEIDALTSRQWVYPSAQMQPADPEVVAAMQSEIDAAVPVTVHDQRDIAISHDGTTQDSHQEPA